MKNTPLPQYTHKIDSATRVLCSMRLCDCEVIVSSWSAFSLHIGVGVVFLWLRSVAHTLCCVCYDHLPNGRWFLDAADQKRGITEDDLTECK
jgi:hypothetical protein